MKDGFGRDITYARLSVTDLCNFRCRYCMPECGIDKKPHEDILTVEEFFFISSALADLGITKQRITGGEPLVRRGVMELIESIGGNPAVKELDVTTNGARLKETAERLKQCGVARLNISLDTLDEERFFEVTGGGKLSDTLDGIAAAKEAGFTDLKLNAVLLNGVNDFEVRSFAEYARDNGLELRFIELMPFVGQREYSEEHFISADDVIKRFDMRFSYFRNKVAVYTFPDGLEVGFIMPLTHKFCSECNRIRITADGKLLNCLHENKEYDLRPYLSDGNGLKEYIKDCVAKKPAEHRLASGILQQRNMKKIGG